MCNLCHKVDLLKHRYLGRQYLKVKILGGKSLEHYYLDFGYFCQLAKPPLSFPSHLI